MIPLAALNTLDQPGFTMALGHVFEHSPWIPHRTWPDRPFASLEDLHAKLMQTIHAAPEPERLSLLRAHPDLVGRLAREGSLTPASTAEQQAAGLTAITPEEAAAFDRYNAAYREKFGFPFIICARESKKTAILAAFPLRLAHDRNTEIAAALDEIAKIALLRLRDTVC